VKKRFQKLNVKSIKIPYFPAHKTHFFPRKLWRKFDLRLMRWGYVLFPNLQIPVPASSENKYEDDFSGSDDDFLGFCDE